MIKKYSNIKKYACFNGEKENNTRTNRIRYLGYIVCRARVKFLSIIRAITAFWLEGKRSIRRYVIFENTSRGMTIVTTHALRMRNENDQMCVSCMPSRHAAQYKSRGPGEGNYNAYNTRHLTSSTYNYAIVNRQTFRRIQTRPSYRNILPLCCGGNASGNIRVISRGNSHIVS